jgi:transcriptional regulator with XRE-family HTH domain
MTTAEQLGSQIKLARDAAKLSLRALGEIVEISASTIGEYERGVRVPEADKLARIASALNCFTFRVDSFAFSIGPGLSKAEESSRNEQLRLDFEAEYGYGRAHVRIEPGKITVAFDGARAPQRRSLASRG